MYGYNQPTTSYVTSDILHPYELIFPGPLQHIHLASIIPFPVNCRFFMGPVLIRHTRYWNTTGAITYHNSQINAYNFSEPSFEALLGRTKQAVGHWRPPGGPYIRLTWKAPLCSIKPSQIIYIRASKTPSSYLVVINASSGCPHRLSSFHCVCLCPCYLPAVLDRIGRRRQFMRSSPC